jgi:hypothetical protein
MRTVTADATSALVDAVSASFASFAVDLTVEEVVSRAWASVTFRGARHEIGLRLEGEGAVAAASEFVKGLEAADFRLPGHVVADIALLSETRQPRSVSLRLEALTVRDR